MGKQQQCKQNATILFMYAPVHAGKTVNGIDPQNFSKVTQPKKSLLICSALVTCLKSFEECTKSNVFKHRFRYRELT